MKPLSERQTIQHELDATACKAAVYAALVLAQRAGLESLTDVLADAHLEAIAICAPYSPQLRLNEGPNDGR